MVSRYDLARGGGDSCWMFCCGVLLGGDAAGCMMQERGPFWRPIGPMTRSQDAAYQELVKEYHRETQRYKKYALSHGYPWEDYPDDVVVND